MSLHFHPLRVASISPEGDDAIVVTLEVPPPLADTFRFTSGQYLTLRQIVDGEDLRRSYSICAGEDEGLLRVGIRKVAGGRFSTWVSERLRCGDTIEVIAPQGHFTLPGDVPVAPRHLLCIAAGSGITPILSIVKTVLAREPESRVTLLYGNRRLRSTMFIEELEDLKNRYLSRFIVHFVFSQEQPDLDLARGRLSQEKIAQFVGPLLAVDDVDHAFICGPHGLNDDAQAALLAAGLPAERIHIERFGVPPSAEDGLRTHLHQEGDAANARITVIRDGLTREVDYHSAPQGEAASILDTLGAAGLEVPYSCKSGVCSTCRARLLDGQVRMARNFALDPQELAAGFVLTCQAHPLTDHVVLSFDDR